jgi:nucleoside-diphosphate-sugar epimerase
MATIPGGCPGPDHRLRLGGPSLPAAGCRIVVLGSTGFLGRHVSDGLTAQGADVLPVSRSAGRAGRGGPRTARLNLLTSSPGQIARLLAAHQAQAVVNAAGVVWADDETPVRAGNAELVSRLLRALNELPAPPRLIHLGSIHEYGPCPPGGRLHEDQRPAPVTPYGRDKLASTCQVLAAARGPALDGVVLRLANVAGSDMPPGSIFGQVAAHLTAIAEGPWSGPEPPPLRLPKLLAHRDIVDVRDVVSAVCAAASAPESAVSGQVINIGSGRATAMRDLVTQMISLAGLPVSLEETPSSAPALTHVTWQRLDITRARQRLGWVPRHSLDDSLRSVLGRMAVPVTGVSPALGPRCGRTPPGPAPGPAG